MPLLVTRRTAQAWEPTSVEDGDGTLHLAWVEGPSVMQTRRTVGGAWEVPSRLAAGESPSLAVDPEGNAHLLLSNLFDGVVDIYHVSYTGGGWTLPVNVSRTIGHSSTPVLRTGSAEAPLVAAWSELGVGGTARVHVARWDGERWRHAPVLDARGLGPELAPLHGGSEALDGAALAWHARADRQRPFELMAALRINESWTLPERVSDSEADATVASAAHSGGRLHVAWRESGAEDGVRYSGRGGATWTNVQALSENAVAQPRLIVSADGRRDVVWGAEDGVWSARAAGDGAWLRSAVPGAAGARELTAARGSSGVLHIAWTAEEVGNGSGLWYSVRFPCHSCTVWVPIGIKDR